MARWQDEPGGDAWERHYFREGSVEVSATSGKDGGPPVTALIQVPSAVYVSDATWEEVRPRLEHLAAQLRMAVEAVNRAP
jgi:hypothetical protein